MKRLGVIIGAVLILIIGGGLTAQLVSQNSEDWLPVQRQVADPEGNTLAAEPWEAQQFVLLVGFILFNLIGMGVTIAVVMWLLSRQIKKARTQPTVTTTAPVARSGTDQPTPASAAE
jgi:hypothetical protein